MGTRLVNINRVFYRPSILLRNSSNRDSIVATATATAKLARNSIGRVTVF